MYISGFSNFNQYKALPSQQSFAQQNSEKTKQKQEEKSIYADKQAREKLEASLSEKELRSLKTEMFFVQSISIASIASIVGLGIYAIVKCKKAQKQIFDDLKNKFLQNLENPDVADIFKDIFQKTEKDGNIIYKLKDGITLDSKNNLNKNGKRINNEYFQNWQKYLGADYIISNYIGLNCQLNYPMLHKFTLFEQACRNRKLSHTGTNNVVEGFLIMNDIDIEKILLGVYPDNTKSLAEIFVKEKDLNYKQALEQAEECINIYSKIMTF